MRGCPRCGTTLPADGSPCPRCLLELGLGRENQPPPTPSPTDVTLSFASLPTIDAPAGAAVGEGASTRRFAVDERLGPYRLVGVLGRGGFGEVWEAEDERDGRRVALKLLSARLDADARERFRSEGRILASIHHPRVVFVFAADELDGVPAIAMELHSGGTLEERVREKGPLPWREAVARLLELVDGLEAAERAGVLHRDVKPSNAFLDEKGEARIGDFGLSVPTAAGARSATTSGYVGTPAFSSPEQVRGAALDVRSDLFALGATLYFLLSGRLPFGEGTVGQVLARVVGEEPPRLDRQALALPRGLERVVRRLLAKDPSARLADYRALRVALLPFTRRRLDAGRLGLRLVAHWVDVWTLVAIGLFAQLARVGFDFERLPGAQLLSGSAAARAAALASDPLEIARVAPWALALGFLYYLACEYRYGRTPGKALVGLAVRAADGSPAGLRPLVWRSLIYVGWSTALPLLVRALPAVAPGLGDRRWIPLVATFLPLTLLVTLSARNGYRGVHELASGTCVVAEPLRARRRSARTAAAAAEATPAVAGHDLPDRLGPYRILGRIALHAESELVAGFDAALERRVWLELALDPADAPAAAAAAASVERDPWFPPLQSGGAGERRWTAFALPDGAALLDAALSHETLDPARARAALAASARALARIAAAANDGAALSPDRLWLTGDDRVLVLPFPAPRSPASPEPAAAERSAAPELLHRLAVLLFEARLVPAGALRAGDTPAVPLPPADRAVLERVSARRGSSAAEIAEMLEARTAHRAVATRLQRSFALLLAYSLPALAAFPLLFLRHPPSGEPGGFAYAVSRFVFFSSMPFLALAGLSALLFAAALPAGGLSLTFMRLVIVRADGAPARGWRRLWRAFVTWSPVFLGLVVGLPFLAASPGSPWARLAGARHGLATASLLVFFLGAAFAALHPTRGWQDRIAGTALVPR